MAAAVGGRGLDGAGQRTSAVSRRTGVLAGLCSGEMKTVVELGEEAAGQGVARPRRELLATVLAGHLNGHFHGDCLAGPAWRGGLGR